MTRAELLTLLRDVLDRLTSDDGDFRRGKSPSSAGQRRRGAVGDLVRRRLQLRDHLGGAGAGGSSIDFLTCAP